MNTSFKQAREEMGKVIVGQERLLERLWIALLADGHLLIEGLPGLAKTLAVTTLASVTGCDWKRIQFTPDLLPADLIGTTIYNPKEGTFSVNKGPIFTQLLLADEINRSPAKVQSALLEVMQEKQATIGGETFKTGSPFMVLATQNPIESEGTYPLPEAQTDRFMMKVKVGYPTLAEEKEILHRMATLGPKPVATAILTPAAILQVRQEVNQARIDEKVTDYILRLVEATRQKNIYIQYGASPRASIAFTLAGKAYAYLQGRDYVTPNDIKMLAHDILRHRIRPTYEAEAETLTSDDLIDQILEAVSVP